MSEAYLTETIIPAGRVVDPEELAKRVYRLLVDGTYCNGTSLVFDGGVMGGQASGRVILSGNKQD